MKYHIKIFGCQYNEWDGARIDTILKRANLVESPEKDAEIILVMACSVKQMAVDKLMGKVRNWLNENKRVFISGCLLPGDRRKLENKGVRYWDNKKPEELYGLLKINPQSFQSATNCSYLPIMLGCNNFCSYCVVPYVRGKECSRPFEEVVSNFKELIANGQKDILLLGQNVNSYKFNFAKLLKTLNDLPGDFTISFTSNHPKDMSDDIINAIKDLPKIKKEIHLPLQSGSDKILKAMNRPYSKKQYLDLVAKIKKSIPGIRISTDVIVGFPGETEVDFEETKNILKEVGYYWVFVNKYSPREGTAAYKLGDPIPWAEKQRRWKILDNLVNKK